MDFATEITDLLARHGFRRFLMSRTEVGHLKLVAHFGGQPVDTVVDTGASKTFLELHYCQEAGIAVEDTGQSGHGGNVYTVSDVPLTLDGMPIQTDGLYAIDMSSTNQRLTLKGFEPIRAVIGQDVLRHHEALIDYAGLALFLKAELAS